jgi:large conductance mechanosensitive channel
MWEEFKKFALKGNVVDLAIAVIIGAAFGRIIESAVTDMIMPLIGTIGGLDFSNYFIPLSKSVTATTLADARKQGPVLAWGNFVTFVINFVIIAWVLFLAVKGMIRLRVHEETKPAPPPRQEVLLEEIRDLLAKKTS